MDNPQSCTLVYLGLGSSQGDKKQTLLSAFAEIEKWGEGAILSSLIESEPWGGVAENTFVNAACSLKTCLSPEELLEKIHETERAFDRVREKKWGDRTLDIDILLYGDEIIDTEKLTIPHLYILQRDFVTTPLKELMGESKFTSWAENASQ